MYMNIKAMEKGNIVALCDKDLIGKVLTEGEVVLDLKTYSSFYKGKLVDETRASIALKHQDTLSMNLVGKKSVGVALSLGLASEKDLRVVAGVPHVQLYRL